MPVIVNLDVVLAQRKVRAKDVAARVGISETQMSLLRTGKVKGVRFETLAKICLLLRCQPGDILAYVPDANDLLASDSKGESA